MTTHAWQTGLYFDTMFTTTYPPNLPTNAVGGLTPTGFKYYFATDATSYHAGGLNFAFCRWLGSVHQELDSIVDVPHRGRRFLWRSDSGRHNVQRQHDYLGRNHLSIRGLSGAVHSQRRRSHQLRLLLKVGAAGVRRACVESDVSAGSAASQTFCALEPNILRAAGRVRSAARDRFFSGEIHAQALVRTFSHDRGRFDRLRPDHRPRIKAAARRAPRRRNRRSDRQTCVCGTSERGTKEERHHRTIQRSSLTCSSLT